MPFRPVTSSETPTSRVILSKNAVIHIKLTNIVALYNPFPRGHQCRTQGIGMRGTQRSPPSGSDSSSTRSFPSPTPNSSRMPQVLSVQTVKRQSKMPLSGRQPGRERTVCPLHDPVSLSSRAIIMWSHESRLYRGGYRKRAWTRHGQRGAPAKKGAPMPTLPSLVARLAMLNKVPVAPKQAVKRPAQSAK